MSTTDVLDRAIAHHRAGRLAEARSLYGQVLEQAPDDFDALHLLGVVEHQEKHYATAVELIRRALLRNPRDTEAQNHLGDAYVELGEYDRARASYESALVVNPGHALAHNGLGITFERQQRFAEATDCFRRAAAARPEWAIAHFNLGLCLKKLGRTVEAAEALRAAWRADPSMLRAARECVDAAAELARAESFRNPEERASAPPSRSTSIVFCSIDDVKCQATIAMYSRLFAGAPHELIVIRDADSLSEAYNRGALEAKGDVILFSHDDVDILAADFAARLHRHLERFDAVGVMGATRMSGPAWTWSRHPHLRGWITHRDGGSDGWSAAVVDPRPVADGIAVLDGVLMAARRWVVETIPFDEDTFDGFHLYDIDWSHRAFLAGHRLGVTGDLGVVHASRGNFGEDWAYYAGRFCEKYRLNDLAPPPPSQLFEARFETPGKVLAFFEHLAGHAA